ncbi:hypothetical protein KM043_012744 [Ampulex compressa]|nr:hypothetical protein KM043_012744 [Ampulex compressa]
MSLQPGIQDRPVRSRSSFSSLRSACSFDKSELDEEKIAWPTIASKTTTCGSETDGEYETSSEGPSRNLEGKSVGNETRSKDKDEECKDLGRPLERRGYSSQKISRVCKIVSIPNVLKKSESLPILRSVSSQENVDDRHLRSIDFVLTSDSSLACRKKMKMIVARMTAFMSTESNATIDVSAIDDQSQEYDAKKLESRTRLPTLQDSQEKSISRTKVSFRSIEDEVRLSRTSNVRQWKAIAYDANLQRSYEEGGLINIAENPQPSVKSFYLPPNPRDSVAIVDQANSLSRPNRRASSDLNALLRIDGELGPLQHQLSVLTGKFRALSLTENLLDVDSSLNSRFYSGSTNLSGYLLHRAEAYSRVDTSTLLCLQDPFSRATSLVDRPLSRGSASLWQSSSQENRAFRSCAQPKIDPRKFRSAASTRDPTRSRNLEDIVVASSLESDWAHVEARGNTLHGNGHRWEPPGNFVRGNSPLKFDGGVLECRTDVIEPRNGWAMSKRGSCHRCSAKALAPPEATFDFHAAWPPSSSDDPFKGKNSGAALASRSESNDLRIGSSSARNFGERGGYFFEEEEEEEEACRVELLARDRRILRKETNCTRDIKNIHSDVQNIHGDSRSIIEVNSGPLRSRLGSIVVYSDKEVGDSQPIPRTSSKASCTTSVQAEPQVRVISVNTEASLEKSYCDRAVSPVPGDSYSTEIEGTYSSGKRQAECFVSEGTSMSRDEVDISLDRENRSFSKDVGKFEAASNNTARSSRALSKAESRSRIARGHVTLKKSLTIVDSKREFHPSYPSHNRLDSQASLATVSRSSVSKLDQFQAPSYHEACGSKGLSEQRKVSSRRFQDIDVQCSRYSLSCTGEQAAPGRPLKSFFNQSTHQKHHFPRSFPRSIDAQRSFEIDNTTVVPMISRENTLKHRYTETKASFMNFPRSRRSGISDERSYAPHAKLESRNLRSGHFPAGDSSGSSVSGRTSEELVKEDQWRSKSKVSVSCLVRNESLLRGVRSTSSSSTVTRFKASKEDARPTRSFVPAHGCPKSLEQATAKGIRGMRSSPEDFLHDT